MNNDVKIRGIETPELCLCCGCQAEIEITTPDGVEKMCFSEALRQYPDHMADYGESMFRAMQDEAEVLDAQLQEFRAEAWHEENTPPAWFMDEPNPYMGMGCDF